jgi:hypothetical protein
VVLRCTSKLLDLLGKPPVAAVNASPTDDDWYANLLWLDRRKCVLLTHAGTLFPVLAADVRKRDLQPIGRYVVDVIETALHAEDLPLDILGRLNPNCVRLARTASRSILGFMNEMALHCRYHIADTGGLHPADIDALNRRLRRTLHNRGGYHDPLELVAQRLQAR